MFSASPFVGQCREVPSRNFDLEHSGLTKVVKEKKKIFFVVSLCGTFFVELALLYMRHAFRWLEPFVASTVDVVRLVKTDAERAAQYRRNKLTTRKAWESAAKVASRQVKSALQTVEWSSLIGKLPRSARRPFIGEKCVFIDRGLRKLPARWPRATVVGRIGVRYIVRRRIAIRSAFAAVDPKDLWYVPQSFKG